MTKTKKMSDSDLLRIALKVVIDKGPDSFTLADISRKAKLAPATLIQRFQTKEKLLLAVLKQATQELRVETEAQLSSWQDKGIEGLIDYLCGISKGVTRDNFAEHLALLAKDFSIPILNRISNEHLEQIRKTIRVILDKALEKGQLKQSSDLEVLTLNVEALWHGSAIQWAFLKRGSLSEWIRERIESFFVGYRR